MHYTETFIKIFSTIVNAFIDLFITCKSSKSVLKQDLVYKYLTFNI